MQDVVETSLGKYG